MGMKAAMAGGKGRKKKWSKGKMKEKLNNLVLFDKPTLDKLIKEIPKAKLITPSIISERLKVNGAIARLGIRHLLEQDLIMPVGEHHHAQLIYPARWRKVIGGSLAHLLRIPRA